MISKLLRLPLLAVASAALLGNAFAQNYTHEPFHENPALHSHNYAINAMEIRLYVLGNVVVDDEEVYEEAVEGLEDSLIAIAGTLNAADANLYTSLADVIEQLEDAVEEGADLSDLVTEARFLVDAARAAILDPAINDDPVALGALLARLMLADGGVAEGWEEIFEDELAEFVIGWAALQHSYELWAHLEPYANENQAFEVRDSLDFMAEELFPSFLPPEGWHLMDAEAGEAPAHRIVSYLEAITDATLYPQRDLATLVVLIDDLAVSACEIYAGGDSLLGEEVLAQSYYFYDENLPRMLNLFDPDLQEAIQADFEAVADTGSADECASLLENVSSARSLLGG